MVETKEQTEQTNIIDLQAVKRLSRDLKIAAKQMTIPQARYMVDAYYTIQEYRKASANQVRALNMSGEPCEVIGWLEGNMDSLEDQIKRALDAWTDTHLLGRWAKSIVGIGPVITAGLMAHIDISKAPTAGHIWRFAGLDPTREWLGNDRAAALVKEATAACSGNLEMAVVFAAGAVNVKPATLRATATLEDGEETTLTSARLVRALARRPWNAALKTLCWKIGESFVKVSNHKDDVYGHFYSERKQFEWTNNLSGALAVRAEEAMTRKRFGADTQSILWYGGQFDPATVREVLAKDGDLMKLPKLGPEQGVRMLPPAHIHARAKRWPVKLFLSHFHHVAYEIHFNEKPPKPYVIDHLGHTHIIGPPNWPMN